MDGQRRSSLSQILDGCIKLLADFIDQKTSEDDLRCMMINNTFLVELRPFVWSYLLGLIPRTSDIFEISQTITKNRKKYDSIANTTFSEITSQSSYEKLTDPKLKEEMEKVIKSFEELSNQYDLLKSNIVKATISKLYFLWRIQNKYEGFYLQPLYILTTVAFALYPSVLHSGESGISEVKSKEDATPRNLFYLINNEDFFDADVYNIFSEIMTKVNIIQICQQNEKFEQIDYSKLIEGMKGGNIKDLHSKLDFHQKLSFLYIHLTNKDIIELFEKQKYDPFPILREWYTFILTNVFPLNNIIYLWDVILISKQFNDMLGYLVGGMIRIKSEKLLESKSAEESKLIIEQFLSEEISLKDIVKKALKISEKIHED